MSSTIPPMMKTTQGTALCGTALLARLPRGGLNFAIYAMVAPRFRLSGGGGAGAVHGHRFANETLLH